MQEIHDEIKKIRIDLDKAEVGRLFDKVREWGRDRNITDIKAQLLKIWEESGEIAKAYNHRGGTDTDEFIDAIGDTLVTIIIAADIAGYRAEDCLESAYKEISPRTGKLLNGSWIKDNQ